MTTNRLNTRVLEKQANLQQLLIADLRSKLAGASRNKADADYAIQLHAMLAHALAGLASLCQASQGGN